MKKYQLIFIFLISYYLINIIECKYGAAMEALTIASIIKTNISIKFIPEPITPENIVPELIKQLKSGINDDDKLRNDVRHFLNYIVYKYNATEERGTLFETLDWDITRIDDFYEPFNRLLKLNVHANLTVLESYFKIVLSEDDDGVTYALNQMQNSGKKIFELLRMDTNDIELCNDNMILRQQHILHLLNVVINKAYRGYFLIISAYKFFIRRYTEYHERDLEIAFRNAESDIRNYVLDARIAMYKTSKNIRNCHNNVDIKNVTYTEIGGPIRGFVFDSSAVDINNKCEDYNGENKVVKDSCISDKSLCYGQSCAADGGILKNCNTIGGTVIDICPAIDETKSYSSIKTWSAKWGNATTFENCPRKTIEKKISVESGIFSFSKTGEFCYCQCERIKSRQGDVRSIFLLWTTSNYLENKVITSLKFEEKNGMITLGAQEGVLLPGGFIDQKTVKPVETIHPRLAYYENGLPAYSYSSSRLFRINGERKLLNDDIFYFENNLEINLDHITVPQGQVIVGAKLNRSEAEEDKGRDVLELVVLSVSFNIVTGKLNTSELHHTSATKFMMNKLKHTKRHKIELGRVTNPISMQGKNNEISPPHSKIEFRLTDKVQDLGQSIVPFFDIRDTSPMSLTLPLSTIGLYHRGTKDSGGFIGFDFESYDIENYFENVIYNNTVYY